MSRATNSLHTSVARMTHARVRCISEYDHASTHALHSFINALMHTSHSFGLPISSKGLFERIAAAMAAAVPEPVGAPPLLRTTAKHSGPPALMSTAAKSRAWPQAKAMPQDQYHKGMEGLNDVG